MSFDQFINKRKSELATLSTDQLEHEIQTRKSSTNLFPLDVFNIHVKPFINDLHTKMDIPASYIGLGLLSCYSTAIGNSYVACRGGKDKMCLAIWACMNGISSSGKSLVINYTHEEIENHQDLLDREREDAISGLTKEQQERIPTKKISYRDSNIYTLARNVLPSNPKGILKHSDEILEWINSMNGVGKKDTVDEQFWISAWNALKYSAIRSGNVNYNIPRVFLNIIGGIQPNLIYKLFQNNRGDSGFVFRLLFANTPYDKIAEPEPGYGIPIEYSELHNKCVRQLINSLKLDSFDDDQKKCVFTKEAFDEMTKWEKEKITTINKIPDVADRNTQSGIYGKIKEYIYRFASILRIVDHTYNQEEYLYVNYPDELKINSDVMKRAIRLGDYFYNSATEVAEKVSKATVAPAHVLIAAALFKQGKSYADIAFMLYGDKKLRLKAERFIKASIKKYPKVFNATNS